MGKNIQLFAQLSEDSTGTEEQTRRFVEGVFVVARSGSQWRLLSREYGKWNTVYRRFADWAERGVWYKMLYYFMKYPNMEYIMIDSTILRAHACASGAVKKTRKLRMSRR